MVSRFESYKGFDDLIAWTEQWQTDDLPWRMVAVTDDKGCRYLRKNALKVVETGRLVVEVSPSRETLNNLYRESDCCLQPSYHEGFGLPVVEALAAGLPVVYRRGSAMDELDSPGVVEGVSRDARPEDWTACASRLLALKESEHFEEARKKHYRSLATWRQSAEALGNLYLNVLAAR